jgi:hypothetical protein
MCFIAFTLQYAKPITTGNQYKYTFCNMIARRAVEHHNQLEPGKSCGQGLGRALISARP